MYGSVFYMGVLLCWISHTRTVDFLEILTHTSYRLASRSLAVSKIFLLLVFESHPDFLSLSLVSPLMEVSLRCSLPLGISTAHVFRAPGELFIPSRTRQAYPGIPFTFLSSFAYTRDRGTRLGHHPFRGYAAIFRRV